MAMGDLISLRGASQICQDKVQVRMSLKKTEEILSPHEAPKKSLWSQVVCGFIMFCPLVKPGFWRGLAAGTVMVRWARYGARGSEQLRSRSDLGTG